MQTAGQVFPGHCGKKLAERRYYAVRIKAVLLFGLAMLILTACGGRKEDQKMASAPEFVFTYAENQAEDYPTTQGACRFARCV